MSTWVVFTKNYIKPTFSLLGSTAKEVTLGPALVAFASHSLNNLQFVEFNTALKILKRSTLFLWPHQLF